RIPGHDFLGGRIFADRSIDRGDAQSIIVDHRADPGGDLSARAAHTAEDRVGCAGDSRRVDDGLSRACAGMDSPLESAMKHNICDRWRGVSKVVIGMCHLPPLPGSPRFAGSVAKIREWVLRDAAALAEGGVHGIVVENFGDVPFYPGRVPAYVVSHMTTIA